MPDLAPILAVETAPLFGPLRTELITLLRSLTPSDWDAPTIAGAWQVRDVVAHLLDGELRTLAAHRDGHALAAPGTVHDGVSARLANSDELGASHSPVCVRLDRCSRRSCATM
ncbi:MAG TPA: maleylpyruvate isomerase N-terminal domain-containing protein [Vicinamibacterales bacterium]|nr:maleylpyruvate isomerase N-terminal domain-containing protein [Vicinamibacterales bacterium]